MYKQFRQILLCLLVIIGLNPSLPNRNLQAKEREELAVTFSPLVLGQAASMNLEFVLEKDLETYDWIEFSFSWNTVFPFLAKDETKKRGYKRAEQLCFNNNYQPWAVMLRFPTPNQMMISKGFLLAANTKHTLSLWKEFGLTLPDQPGLYSIQIRTQHEKEWREVVSFQLTADNWFSQTKLPVMYDDLNYRSTTSIAITLPYSLFPMNEEERYDIKLVLPKDTLLTCLETPSMDCLYSAPFQLEAGALKLNHTKDLSAVMNVDKTISFTLYKKDIQEREVTILITPKARLINPIPGSDFLAASINQTWYQSNEITFTYHDIPVQIIAHSEGRLHFLIYFYLPLSDKEIRYSTISLLQPSEWKIKWNETRFLTFGGHPFHHVEKYMRDYLVFQKKANQDESKIEPGEVKEFFFQSDHVIQPVSFSYSIAFKFRLDRSCFFSTREVLIETESNEFSYPNR